MDLPCLHLRSVMAKSLLLAALSAVTLWAAPSISSVVPNSAQVGTYEKLELTVALKATYTNPYDSTQLDLSAQFTAPSKKVWKVNGFWDGTQWRIRFAANETGSWTYVAKVIDASGTAQSTVGTFTVTASANHGWVRIAPNKRYLAYDDGTSFYGIGACEAWGPSTTTLTSMQNLGYNTWVYWNGTYDGSGGNNLIESTTSGLGQYDQNKSVRIDSLINWSEARGLSMILVIWAHDYLCDSTAACPKGWAANFYSDANAWTYQQKLYRYIIARWGYSRALEGWQTIDEISGTDGYASNATTANAWAAKIASYFQTEDPFRHLTTGSLGGYWTQGDAANDVANTEDYSTYTADGVAKIVKALWSNYTKPAIMGETGLGGPEPTLWSAVANGAAITPLLWQFQSSGDKWVSADETAYGPIVSFVKGIDFAHLTNPAQASVTVTGANAYGITSTQLTFGYISGSFANQSLSVTGLANGSYSVEWWNTTAGSIISTTTATVTTGSASLKIATTTNSDIAYKIIAQTATSSSSVGSSSSSATTAIRYGTSTSTQAHFVLFNSLGNSSVISPIDGRLQAFRTDGTKIYEQPVLQGQAISLQLPSGMYLLKWVN